MLICQDNWYTSWSMFMMSAQISYFGGLRAGYYRLDIITNAISITRIYIST